MESTKDHSPTLAYWLNSAIGGLCMMVALTGCGGYENSALKAGEAENGVPRTKTSVSDPVLQVGAVFNADSIRLRLHFKTETPSWYHRYWVYDGNTWQVQGSGSAGREPDGLYEDRISIMWDDGSVEGFDILGGYLTAHGGVVSTRSEASAEAVRAHPILGGEMGQDEITKFIPQSRTQSDITSVRWQDVRAVEELEMLRRRGVFIDLWQWRAHRSHPLGYGDNGYVLEARKAAEGQSMYISNVAATGATPAWMYNPSIAGNRALRLESLLKRAYGQNDPYFLALDDALAFDPDHEWQQGDAIPQVVLRQPDGSRAAIKATGGYADGAWDIQLTRSLQSPNPLDSKTLEPGKVYNVAFAVHQASGTFHHLVSVPIRLGIGVAADITAVAVDGALDAVDIELQAISLFSPGDPTLPPAPLETY